jgi:hypothetical protein
MIALAASLLCLVIAMPITQSTSRWLVPPPPGSPARLPFSIAISLLLAIAGLATIWITVALIRHTSVRPHRAEPVLTIVLAGMFVAASWRATAGTWKGGGLKPRTAAGLVVALTALLVMLAPLVSMAAWILQGWLMGNETEEVYLATVRVMGGGVVSPASVVVCILAALVASLWSGLRRLSIVGKGYCAYAETRTFGLLCGGAGKGPGPDGQEFADVIDRPIPTLSTSYCLAYLAVLGVVAFTLRPPPPTIDAKPFSWFVGLGTLAVVSVTLLNLAQAAHVWKRLGRALELLGASPIASVFSRIAEERPHWNLSLTPPRLADLTSVAAMFASLGDLRQQLITTSPSGVGAQTTIDLPIPRVPIHPLEVLRSSDAGEMFSAANTPYSKLTTDLTRQPQQPLPLSSAFERSWAVSDRLIGLLRKTWWSIDVAAASAANLKDDPVRGWFARAETTVGIHISLVIRDVLSRVVSALFAAMLSVSLLTAAHLFYVFPARRSYLVLDMMLVVLCSTTAMWILSAVERDRVVSLLRATPGQINWEFVRRIGVYGLLPLLALIGALFPEVKDSLFGWLDPVRKLVSF